MARGSVFLLLAVQIWLVEAAITGSPRKLRTTADAYSWEKYWTQKLPSTPPPREIASLASALSALDAVTLAKRLQVAQSNPGVFDSPFCRNYGFLCGGDVHGPLVCIGPYDYDYNGDRGRCEKEAKSRGHTDSPHDTPVVVAPYQVSKNNTSFHEAKNTTAFHPATNSTGFHQVKNVTMFDQEKNNTIFHQEETLFHDSKNNPIYHKDEHSKLIPFHDFRNSMNTTTFHDTSIGHSENNTKHEISNLFFRPAYLMEGSNIIFPNLDNNLHGRSFLPASIATMMPFDSNRLEKYMQLYEVQGNSNMGISMGYTMSFCNSSNNQVRKCHASIESMVDFVVQKIGSNVVPIVPRYSPSRSMEAQLIAAPIMLSSSNSTSITCHDLMFPYLVYGCHVVPNSGVYNVVLQTSTDSTSFHAPYVCHMDTRSWDPSHMAFIELDAHPGDGAICHWVPENNIIWTNA